MRLACWSWGGRHHAGTVSADGRELTPLSVPTPELGALPLIQALARGEGLPRPAGPRLPVAAATLHAPLPRPLRGLFCVGRNYHDHAAELSASVFRDSLPAEHRWPIVFTKFAECVVGPHDDVRLPPASLSSQIDYESELAVVIGRGGRDIPAARAVEHVFGWTIVNDVTARDVQVRHQQWDLGKSFDTFCPMGPWIVGLDELDARDTRLRGTLIRRDGTQELRQDGHTRDMIFGVPALIETCSRGITLHPGDVIATGTCAGVGMGFQPPKWLAAGDRFRIEIDGIGAIENRFVAA
ncbi:MAG: fumarylacetoacetate hydrolase family protein [Piscinibacter sp.]|uniref:fumarylacetoacetate hydrolase family protein n=1 Tax=Piscinibacter TaxID=1114981 RepID=UPI000FDF319A|nr:MULTISPECIES: fumarylacetoacetate hydrolase family protein [Piscinibacter]MCW5663218.1 fumarylacetoacetate hydrolase family protein [Piscinibacter sp.]